MCSRCIYLLPRADYLVPTTDVLLVADISIHNIITVLFSEQEELIVR